MNCENFHKGSYMKYITHCSCEGKSLVPLFEAMIFHLQRSCSETNEVGLRQPDTVLPKQIRLAI